MEWVFDRTFYSEQKKVQLAASTFVGDAAERWDEERYCRRFYVDRPLDTWYELTKMMRKRIRKNIDDEFRAGMDKIESLFSQWKESSPNPNKVCNVGVETPMKDDSKAPEHVEIAKVDETLPEDHEDDVTRVVTRESQEVNKLIVVSTKDQAGSKNMQQYEDKCYEVVAPVSLPRLSSSLTMPLLDLRTNPFQEEGNDESMREIDRLIEEVIKLMEQVDEEKLGFSTSLFVASKLARNRPKRKPIWTTMWN